MYARAFTAPAMSLVHSQQPYHLLNRGGTLPSMQPMCPSKHTEPVSAGYVRTLQIQT